MSKWELLTDSYDILWGISISPLRIIIIAVCLTIGMVTRYMNEIDR